jgi:regulator of replication initiation timing
MGMIPEDDIEKLRLENEQLRKNLNNLLESGKQQPKGVSFKQTEKASEITNTNYYDKDGPSVLSNPFLKN